MIIGIPKEIKIREYRVGLIPAGVKQLVDRGHKVLVQKSAGEGSGIKDEEYVKAGATIVDEAKDVWGKADLVMKVKEPIEPEFPLMREGLVLYTYLHLAAAYELAHELVKRKVTGIAYETIQLADGSLPALRPMSSVAGGKGILLGGVPGVRRGKVVVVGGGVVGVNATKMAMGLGAHVTVLDVNVERLEYLDDVFFGRIQTLYSDPHNVADEVASADLVVGAVLIAGARAPHLVTKEMIASMEPGSVVVDVSVDQGGCIATCRPTTHDDPTYKVDGVIHYCVTNMPGAVARTSTFALNNATIPYVLKLADKGFAEAIREPALARGLNTYKGHITYEAVAKAVGTEFVPYEKLL